MGAQGNPGVQGATGAAGTAYYGNIVYNTNVTSSAGGALSLDGGYPLHVITLTGNVSGLTLSSYPEVGHSSHVIFTAASEYTVIIQHTSTYICPEAEDLDLTVPAGGYVEIDLLYANSKIYVRGV